MSQLHHRCATLLLHRLCATLVAAPPFCATLLLHHFSATLYAAPPLCNALRCTACAQRFMLRYLLVQRFMLHRFCATLYAAPPLCNALCCTTCAQRFMLRHLSVQRLVLHHFCATLYAPAFCSTLYAAPLSMGHVTIACCINFCVCRINFVSASKSTSDQSKAARTSNIQNNITFLHDRHLDMISWSHWLF